MMNTQLPSKLLLPLNLTSIITIKLVISIVIVIQIVTLPLILPLIEVVGTRGPPEFGRSCDYSEQVTIIAYYGLE